MQFDKGYLSPYMVTDTERMEAVLDDPYILVNQGKISSISDLLPLLEKVVAAGKSLFIIAEDIEGEALSTIVVNKIRGTFTSVAVKAPAFGDRRKAMLQDIAALTGGQVVAPEVGLKLDQVGLEVLGKARRVVVTKDATTIIDGAGDKAEVEGRVNQIKAEIEQSDSDWDKEKLQERWRSSPAASASSRSAPPPRWSSRRRSTASRTPSRRLVPRSRRASSPVAAPRSCTRLGARGRPRATGDEAFGVRIVRLALDAPLAGSPGTAAINGYVVVNKVREGGRATTRPPGSTATWSRRASSTRSR